MAGEVLLALGLLSAVLTLNVYRPLGAPMALAALSSFLGWTVGEFALHHITLQLALTLALAASGGFGEVAGKLGLVLLLSSWGVLLAHYRGGRRAGEVVDLAVRRAFGDDAPATGASSTSPPWRRSPARSTPSSSSPRCAPSTSVVLSNVFSASSGVDTAATPGCRR